jgi:hypothetical protein
MSNPNGQLAPPIAQPEDLPYLASELQYAYADLAEKQFEATFHKPESVFTTLAEEGYTDTNQPSPEDLLWAWKTYYGAFAAETKAFQVGAEIADLSARLRKGVGLMMNNERLIVARMAASDTAATVDAPIIRRYNPVIGKNPRDPAYYGPGELTQAIGSCLGLAYDEERSLILWSKPERHLRPSLRRAEAYYLVPLVTDEDEPAVSLEYYVPSVVEPRASHRH